MAKVKLELTSEQYRTLLELVYLGNWMANSHRAKPLSRFEDLEQVVYGLSEAAGTTELVETDKKEGLSFPTRDFDDRLHSEYIEEYDDETFWEELIDHLAWRDLESKLGAKAVEAMEPKKRFMELDKLRDVYEKEMEEHGVDRLRLTSDSSLN